MSVDLEAAAAGGGWLLQMILCVAMQPHSWNCYLFDIRAACKTENTLDRLHFLHRE